MGFYIYIDSSAENAIRGDSYLTVEDTVHDAIFQGPIELDYVSKRPDGHETTHFYYPKASERTWLKQYPKFWRMSDQYCDCLIYDRVAIQELKTELEEIKKLAKEPNLCKFVDQLMGLCEQAQKSDQKIFCYGD